MTDAEIIKHYGGPTELARLMGLYEKKDVMRIQNWIKRGIPSKVKLGYGHLFLCKRVLQKP